MIHGQWAQMKPNLLMIEAHHNKTKHNKTTCLYYWIYCALIRTQEKCPRHIGITGEQQQIIPYGAF